MSFPAVQNFRGHLYYLRTVYLEKIVSRTHVRHSFDGKKCGSAGFCGQLWPRLGTWLLMKANLRVQYGIKTLYDETVGVYVI